jgi:hypothetical protein
MFFICLGGKSNICFPRTAYLVLQLEAEEAAHCKVDEQQNSVKIIEDVMILIKIIIL